MYNSYREYTHSSLQKPETDHKEYRLIKLENGLRVVLISDLKEGHAPDLSDQGSNSGYESDSEGSEPEEKCNSEGGGDNDESPKPKGKQKSAAALCVNVGSFSDPPELQGLAHYMEHMVFMGSEKYPTENDFDAYISQRGGMTNAWTDSERTMFYFDVRNKHFAESLDRFANFFISPLLNPDSLDRELTAVHSEYEMQVSNNAFVIEQILHGFSKENTPFRTFQSGNKKSLKEIPESQGIDVHSYLHNLRKRMYSAHFMTLAVQAKDTLENLETLVREIFNGVPFNDEAMVDFSHIKEPFDTPEFKRFYLVGPVKDTTELKISWSLPSMLKEYKCHPTSVLGYVVGHEGKGSLISYLRKQNLALGLTAGSTRLPDGSNNSITSMFGITVELTDQGYDNVNQVIEAVFAYLAMFRAKGVQEDVFLEYQQLNANRFRFQELDEPIDSVEYLAQALHCYADEHLLSGSILVHDYKPELYQSLLDRLTADSANYMLISRRHESECTINEPWYNGRYGIRDISAEKIQEWMAMKPYNDFYLPNKNKFIAKCFELLPVTDEAVPPVNLCEELGPEYTKYGSLWYKRDRVFRVPKAMVIFQFWSNLSCQKVENQVLNDLMIYALEQNLHEVAYEAGEASLSYALPSQPDLYIAVNGFNDKLFLLFETVVDHLVDFHVDADRFTSFREYLRQTYTNRAFKPRNLGRDMCSFLLEDTATLAVDKLAALETLTVEDVIRYHDNLLKELFLDGYVHGNMSEKEAKKYFDYATTKLQFKPLSEVIRTRSSEVPIGDTRHRMKNVNPMDVNTVVLNIYQLGLGNLRLSAFNDLFALILSEPCFDFLRTKETLGYHVYLTEKCSSGCLSVAVCVLSQADKFTIDHCHAKIEEFMMSLAPNTLKNLTPKQFQTYVETLIATNQMEDVQMSNEVHRNLNEIWTGAPLFNRREKTIEILNSVTQEELIEFAQKHYFNANTRRKICIEIDADPDAKTHSPSDAPPVKSFDIQPIVLTGPGEDSEVVYAMDVRDLKARLRVLPYHRIID